MLCWNSFIKIPTHFFFSLFFSREWKSEEALFSKIRYDLLLALNIEKAKDLKDQGNQKFKEGHFSEAVQLYTDALEVTPPALKPSQAKDGSLWYV